VKLLLDENLSPKVAEALTRDDGLDACHIRDRGLLGATDPEVLERAFGEDRIFVTKNVGDFEKLARARELHAGIVLIEQGDLTREEQLGLMRRIAAELEGTDLVNRVLRVGLDGTMTIEPMPAGITP
jgi:predicted nuclease of predicted toxin-antitoxin system